jgi:hypothetical protein
MPLGHPEVLTIILEINGVHFHALHAVPRRGTFSKARQSRAADPLTPVFLLIDVI